MASRLKPPLEAGRPGPEPAPPSPGLGRDLWFWALGPLSAGVGESPFETAVTTKIWSPQTMGVESPDPGIAVFHLIFWLLFHWTGGLEPSTTPVWLVPRQMGQLSSEEANVWVVRTAAKAIPMQRDGFRRFIMGVFLGSSMSLTDRMAVEVSQKSGNPVTSIKLWMDSGQSVFRCLGMIQG